MLSRDLQQQSRSHRCQRVPDEYTKCIPGACPQQLQQDRPRQRFVHGSSRTSSPIQLRPLPAHGLRQFGAGHPEHDIGRQDDALRPGVLPLAGRCLPPVEAAPFGQRPGDTPAQTGFGWRLGPPVPDLPVVRIIGRLVRISLSAYLTSVAMVATSITALITSGVCLFALLAWIFMPYRSRGWLCPLHFRSVCGLLLRCRSRCNVFGQS